MPDLIDRQLVINTIINKPFLRRETKMVVISELESFPSAQSQIICCDACKYGVPSGRGDTYLCVVSPENTMEHKYDFWCAYAERRKDG